MLLDGGSMPVFLRKPKATCDFQGGGGTGPLAQSPLFGSALECIVELIHCSRNPELKWSTKELHVACKLLNQCSFVFFV